MADIDAIWSSLKSEDGDLIFQNLKRNRVKRNIKKQTFAFKQQQQRKPFDIDSYAAPIRATQLSHPAKESEVSSDNLSELAVNFLTLEHDSDDEEEEQEITLLRAERIGSFLKNNDIASQIDALTKLKNAIKSLRRHGNDNEKQLQAIMDTCGKALFQLFSHTSEKCRSISIQCIHLLLATSIDLTRILPFLIPSIVARYAPCSYDKDTEIFVENEEAHLTFLRGGAITRQDREGLIGQATFNFIEPNEELRLALCLMIKCLVDSVIRQKTEEILKPYYSELILSTQTGLRDPFHDVKISSAQLLTQLLCIPRFEMGAKYFSCGLARAVLSNCRSRNTAVILASIDLLETSITVPDRAKARGAGSAAIADLVGHKADNAIPIAAFYGSQHAVSVNILAEISSHTNSRVRLRCCKLLQSLLTDLPDKYEHEQRLLPYVLMFINDKCAGIRQAALLCVEKCGKLYERDHADEITERLQLGVDGDASIEYSASLPRTFTRRPSLGARLIVRNNTSRFLLVVLDELTNWKAETRLKSAKLMLIMAVYCEEHLIKDFHSVLKSFAKAIDIELTSHHEHKHLEVYDRIDQALCYISTFVDPSVYLSLIRPRMMDESSHMQRSLVVILSSLIRGASFCKLCPHWVDLLSLITSPNCIGTFTGSKTRAEGLKALRCLCDRASDNVDTLTEHFLQSSGDLSQAFLRCVDALEALLMESNDEDLINECLDQIHFLRTYAINRSMTASS